MVCLKTGMQKKRRRETFVPRRPTPLHGVAAEYYLPQHSEPQQPVCLAFRPAVGHSSTQQSQVQKLHVQLPVSQQPQHSHSGQPTFWLARLAGTKGTRASDTKRIRLFMVGILLMGSFMERLNQSHHVTTCERGKTTAHAHHPLA